MKKKGMSLSEMICESFKLPPETIFQDYKCTLRGSIAFFGRIYVGEAHLLFISSMFGLVKKCVIEIEKLTKVEEISGGFMLTEAQEYTFTGLKNPNAFRLIEALWKREKIAKEVLRSQEEEEHEDAHGRSLDDSNVEASFFKPDRMEEKQRMVSLQLPCNVEQFYDFFLADKAEIYSRKKHLELKGSEKVTITEWRVNPELNSQVRELSAMIKVTGIPFLSMAGMSEVWLLKRIEGNLEIKIVTQMADVPYCSYFNCEQNIMVVKDGEKKCKFEMSITIVFNKPTYMKGTIVGRTLEDLKADYEMWVSNVRDALEKLRKKQEDHESKKNTSGILIEYENSTIGQTKEPKDEKVHPTCSRCQETEKQLQAVKKQLKILFLFIAVLLGIGIGLFVRTGDL